MNRIERAPSYPVSIFIAGDFETAKRACAAFCDDVGLCVTVTPTTYIFTGGNEDGVIVGLINYPRFPATPEAIEKKALRLAEHLREWLRQESFSIQTPARTSWFSWREADLALATGSRRAKTPQAVECEASQSGPKGNAQGESHDPL